MRIFVQRLFFSVHIMAVLSLFVSRSIAFSARNHSVHRSLSVCVARHGSKRLPYSLIRLRALSTGKDDSSSPNEKVSSSFSSSNSKSWKLTRRLAGGLFSVAGFVSSSIASLVTDRGQYKRQWKPTFHALRRYLNETGIGQELREQVQSSRLLDNIAMLARVQTELFSIERRTMLVATSTGVPSVLPPPAEVHRYLRHATAVYGDSMIRAVEAEVHGVLDNRISPLVKSRIAEHVRLREEDIALLDVDSYGSSTNHLRHYVAVDHDNRQIILAVRGTFSLSEVFVDVAGFSRPFCSGEAHSEMANMAENIWNAAGELVLDLMKQNSGYQLVLTGHSLGAGTACLLNILLHHEGYLEGSMMCYAFAPPPVFYSSENVSQAKKSCISFIHQNDIVPSLSVDAVRHIISSLATVGSLTKEFGWRKRLQLVTGRKAFPEHILDAVETCLTERLEPKPGAPVLSIPAAVTLWLVDRGEDDFEAISCDPERLARVGMVLDSNMMLDHFPPRYAHALNELERHDSWTG